MERGEHYWNEYKFFKTTSDAEVELIARKNIPINTFYIKSETQLKFAELSTKTKG